ncbi:MAG: hypothetical protein HRU15_09195, partial [Planctomycetes bacterium]|nr:hypothetical protein [Planctomycetota bacterium]
MKMGHSQQCVSTAIILICCSFSSLSAASSWQAAEDAGRLAATDKRAAISELLDILIEEPQLHVAHYNLACILLEYQSSGDYKKAAPLNIDGLPDSDPLLLAAEHLEQASSSPVAKLANRARHNLALARFQQGRLEDALREASLAVDAFPENESYRQTRNELRRIYLYRLDEARRKAEEAAKRLRLSKQVLADAFVGRKYTHQLEALGGSGGYKFSSKVPDPAKGTASQVTDNNNTESAVTAQAAPVLPEDLNVSINGLLSGMPNDTSAGQHALHFIIQDSSDETVEGEVQLKIWPRAKITSEHLPEAIINQSYQAVLECEGLPQAVWFVEGLPDGLSIKHSTGPRILIEGSATKLGEFAVNITAKDTKNDLITVAALKLLVSDSFAPDTSNMPEATAWAA